jgi:phosphoribosylglycinamide formyltransferase-1
MSAPTEPARLAVMLSGGGRTLMNLLDVIDRGELGAEVVRVIASRECGGAERARDRGLDVRVIPGEIPADRLAQLLDAVAADWVVLAGYLKYVHIPAAYQGRVVNIHPALLPDFGGPGMFGEHVHRAVFDAGATESGCTVHLCDDRYDHGQIILQKRCPVLADDTPETLAARVFELECVAYPEALQLLIAGRVSVSDRGMKA